MIMYIVDIVDIFNSGFHYFLCLTRQLAQEPIEANGLERLLCFLH